MRDVYEQAADRADVPDDLREEVITRVRAEHVAVVAEVMHYLLVTGELPDIGG